MSGVDAGFGLGNFKRLGGGTNPLFCQNIPHPHEIKEFLVRGGARNFLWRCAITCGANA